MNNTELLIYLDGVWQEIELAGNVGFVLEYNIAEIKDIAKRKSSFSKTITVPDTASNRAVLQGLFDSNNVIVSDLDIDTEFVLLRDYVQIMSGNILIRAVKENDGQFKYEAVLKSETNQLFKNIGDKELDDIDLSYLNHSYTGENVVATWTASNSAGYYYPLIDYNFKLDRERLQTDKFNNPKGLGGLFGLTENLWRPAIYVRNIVDNIIQDAGYNYTSNFLSSDDVYNNLIIPFSREKLKATDEFIRNNSFQVGLTFSGVGLTDPNYNFDFANADQVITHTDLINIDQQARLYTGTTSIIGTRQTARDGGIIDFRTNATASTIYTEPYEWFEDTFVFDTGWKDLKLTDELLTPYGDGNNYWDTSNYTYTEDNIKTQKFRINLDFWVNKTAIDDYCEDAWSPNFLDKIFPGPPYRYVSAPLIGVEVPKTAEAGYVLKVRLVRISNGNITGTIPMDGINGKTNELIIYQNRAGDSQIYSKYQVVDDNGQPYNFDNNIVQTQGDAVRYNMQFDSLELDGNTYGTVSSVFFDASKLKVGEQVRVQVKSQFLGLRESSLLNYEASGGATTSVNVAVFNSGKDAIDSYESGLPVSGRTYLGNVVDNAIAPRAEIDMNLVLPDKIKQKDFLNSIIKMFNLYVDVDKNNPNNLIIEPRDDFFNDNDILNWSDKLDLNKEINQELLYSDAKSYLLTHKDDSKDIYLDDYKSKENEIYGQYEYFRRNDEDFKEKTKQEKIETIFTTAALKETSDLRGVVYPSFVVKDSKGDGIYKSNSIRLMQRCRDGKIKIQNNGGIGYIKYPVDQSGNEIPLLTTTQSTNVEGGIFDEYPYAGNFDYPYSPDNDIHFGSLKRLYYSQNRVTNNTLFEKYWRNTIEEIANKDSRKITAYFDLDAYDIANFDFTKLVQVNFLSSDANGLYRVNKISYNPTNESTTKVELIKIFDYEITNTEQDSDRTLWGINNDLDINIGVGVWNGNVDGGISNNPNNSGVIQNGLGNRMGNNNFGILNNSLATTVKSGNKYISVIGASGSQMNSNNKLGLLSGVKNFIYSDNTNFFMTGNNNKIGNSNNNVSIFIGQNNQINDYVNNSGIISGKNNQILNNGATTSTSNNTNIYGGENNTIGYYGNQNIINSSIYGGNNNKIGMTAGQSATPSYSFYGNHIIGGENNVIQAATNSMIINGQGITLTESNTTWIDSENVKITSNNFTINGVPYSGGATPSLDDLTDVSVPSPSNGQVLTYNNVSGEWQAETPSTGGATVIGGLTDVTISSPQDGESLVYNNSSMEWENANLDKFFVNSDTTTYLIRSNQPDNFATGESYSVLLAGRFNSNTSESAFIGTGQNNEVSGLYSSVLNGDNNTISASYSSILGGKDNDITDEYSVITGGQTNETSENHTFIGGGETNQANSQYSAVGGGFCNRIGIASGYSAILGGFDNSVSSNSNFSNVSAGFSNVVSAGYSSILGGQNNQIQTSYSNITGGENNNITSTNGEHNAILGGCQNDICSTQNNFSVTILNGRTNQIDGTNACFTNILNGTNNDITGNYNTLVNGDQNEITAGSYIFMEGFDNFSNNSHNKIMGMSNSIVGSHSSIIGCNNVIAINRSGVNIFGENISANRSCSTFVNNLSIMDIPTSSAGLPSGSVWNDSGTLKIV